MSRFLNKMSKLGSSLKTCFQVASAPIRWDIRFFNRDQDAYGALLLIPALVATAVTVSLALVGAAFLVSVKGVLGGTIAAVQDIFSFGASLFSRGSNRSPAVSPRANRRNDSQYSSTYIGKQLGGPAVSPLPTPTQVSYYTAPRSSSPLPSEKVDYTEYKPPAVRP